MNAAVTGLTDGVRMMEQSDTRPRLENKRVGKPVHAWQRLRRLGLHFQRICWYARSCVSGPAESSETVNDSGDGNSTTRTAVRDIAVSAHDAHAERARNVVKKSQEQRIRGLLTVVHDVRNL